MVKKPDSTSGFRFCIDTRGVIKGVVVKPYALPPIAEILAGTAGCKYFARFDFISSYWQYPLAADSKRHTAFRALGKVYRYTRVPMGSIRASFHVQRSNVKVLGNLYGDGAGVYIDDTPIHAVTLERFVEIIRIVVKKFADAKLYCKSSKCVIGVKSLKLLGHIIDGNGIRMADDRREEVARLKFPDNPKKLRAALGETNYQRAFIPEYALITQPLNKLVNGTTAEMNTEEARTAWKQLMRAIADQMSLFHLDYNQQIRVLAYEAWLVVCLMLVSTPTGNADTI